MYVEHIGSVWLGLVWLRLAREVKGLPIDYIHIVKNYLNQVK